jgi:hypothetical protein
VTSKSMSDSAKADFQRALELNPDSGESHAGYALLISTDLTRADTLYHVGRAQDLHNNSPRLFFALANMYGGAAWGVTNTELGMAFEAVRNGLDLNPTSVYGCQVLSYLQLSLDAAILRETPPPQAAVDYYQWIIETSCHLDEGA